MQKATVWTEAEALGLPVDELKESQEICFVSHGDYRTFIETEMPSVKTPGAFVDVQGRYLGQHDGIAFYTPGQRRGLGIAAGQKLYVQQVQPSTNTVVLGLEEGLLNSSCLVKDLNLFDRSLLTTKSEFAVKVRYATPATEALVEPLDGDTLRIHFHVPHPRSSTAVIRSSGVESFTAVKVRAAPRLVDSSHLPMLRLRANFRASARKHPVCPKLPMSGSEQ
jgi:tRNA-specific 2-thiouridylase